MLLPVALFLSLSLPSSSENRGARSDAGSCASTGNCAGTEGHQPQQPVRNAHAHTRGDDGAHEPEEARRRREEQRRRDERARAEIERQQQEEDAAARAQGFQSASAADEHMRARQRVILSASLILSLMYSHVYAHVCAPCRWASCTLPTAALQC